MFDWIIAYYLMFFIVGIITNYKNSVRMEVACLGIILEIPTLGRMLGIW